MCRTGAPGDVPAWLVPYPGGPFSDDLSRAATNVAAQALAQQ
jgi:hypothetical protein